MHIATGEETGIVGDDGGGGLNQASGAVNCRSMKATKACDRALSWRPAGTIALLKAVPLGQRFAQPEDITPSVVFLASDEAAWLTGERINASSGVH